jgi:hypothetical protein
MASRVLRTVVIVAAISLAGCTQITQLLSGQAITTPSQQVTLSKAEYGFEVTYNTAAQAYLVAAPNLPPAVKAQVKALLLQVLACDPNGANCSGYLVAAREAQAAGDATDLTTAVSNIDAIATQVENLLK